MDNKMTNNNDEIEIDLKRLFRALLGKAWLIGIVAVLFAVGAFLCTHLFMTPEYQSSAMIYVNNSISRGEVVSSITSSDISASRGLVKSYIAILNTRETMEAVSEYAQADLSYAQVQQMITAAAVDATEIIKVVVTSEDPVEAQKIADAVAHVLPERISGIIEGTSAKVVAAADLPLNPSSPNRAKLTLIGFLAGLVLSAALIVLQALLDVKIHSEADIEQVCPYPVLTAVPNMAENASASKYLGKGKNASKDSAKHGMIGNAMGFQALEAYKLLRAKLQFSFADEKACHVIGVCSALSGEGKSVSAINLAHSLSQMNKRVLLIDCDMRRPSVSRKLHLSKSVGLSDFLSSQSQESGLLQMCGIKGDEEAFHVIASGRTPPNPVELLTSLRMKKLLALLREKYEYIILDLPPVGEVSDALAIADQTDGMILVVRQLRCDRTKLANTVRQLEFLNTRVLGVVFNCTEAAHSLYADKVSGGEYSKAYETAARKAAKKSKK